MKEGQSNDHDFVPPTKYKPRHTKKPPGFSPFKLIPRFEAMDLNHTTSSGQIPNTIDSSSPEAVFTLFFTDSVIDRIVRCTNVNAESVRADPVNSRAPNIRFHDSYNQLPWKPVTSSEILAYLGILVYMGIHVEPHVNDYWSTDVERGPVHHPIRNTMSRTRWTQIHRYFHVWDAALDHLAPGRAAARPHEKVDPLAKLLLHTFQRYWKPGTNVAIDECIEAFTGRTSDTVNIPTKPTPIGFKIWVLADEGYVFDLLWHVKGDGKDQGPQGLRRTWENKGFSKTQAVVLELVTRMPNQGKGHAVHLDNLFTSSKLLTTLREYGVGAAGTVRTGQTRREVNDDKRQEERGLHQPAADESQDEDLDESLDLDFDQDPRSFDDPNVQQQLTLLDTIIQDMYQSRQPQEQRQNPPLLPHLLPHSQGHAARAKKSKKEKNFGMNEKLIELKTKWSNHIAWGELYGCLSSDEKVLQLAWKDAQIVLFMTTLVDASATVSRLRKRPNKKDKWIKQAFGDQPFKRLEIPDFIDMYNHLMNGVDRSDQIRTYYRTNRRNYRTWKPLWNYLFQTTICNAALIWMDEGHSTKKKGGHLKFRARLASQLMAHSSSSNYTSPVDGFGIRTNLASHITISRDGCSGTHEMISRDAKACKACMAQGRTAQVGEKRKPLYKLSENSVRIGQDGEKSRKPRPPRTKYGCSACQIHLCKEGTCWGEHKQLSKVVDLG
jgi:hypothetical protein